MSSTTRSLQVRLLATVIGVTAVFFSVLGWVSVERIAALTRRSVHTEALDLVSLRGLEIESFLRERGQVVATMLRTPTLQDFFRGYTTYRRPLESDREYHQVERLFRSVVDADETITGAFLATDTTSEYFRESGRVERPGYDPKTRWWWREAVDKDRLYVSSPGRDAGTGQLAVAVQTTVYLDDGRFLGVGGVDVRIDSLGTLVQSIRFNGVGDAFLVDQSGVIIYFPELSPSGETLGRFSTSLSELDAQAGGEGFAALAERLRQPERGFSRVRWQGVDLIVVHTPVAASSPELRWSLGLLVPEQAILAPIRRARWTTAVAVLLAIGAIALATLLVTHHISRQMSDEERRKAAILAEANLSLLEANRMKSHFLAAMSHELRTPLNSIIGFAQVLESRLNGQIDATLLKFLRNIHSSGQHLLRVISDILDLSKVEAGKMDLEPEVVDLGEAVAAVCTMIHGFARERRIVIETDIQAGMARVEADLVRVKQILFNLLSNAVRFSDEGGTVTVVVRELALDESPLGAPSVEMTVIDRGVGISPEDQEIIFEEFRQAEHSPSNRVGGTGLGLTLVKRLVELHQGAIDLSSSPGEGSAFRVVLPRRFQLAETTGVFYAAAPLPSRAGRAVLVVEDDTTAFEMISRALAAAGYVPERSHAGDDAVAKVVELDPVAVVLDIILPKADGWDILRELKERPDTRHVPVIMVSVLPDQELGLALGADAYFVKPVERERLVARLTELVRGAAATRPRALVIDDDPAAHELLAEILAPAGFVVEGASSGAEGLAAARSRPPEVIVLDLMMDDMDGYDVARELKLDPRTRRTPVVVFTAYQPSREDRERLRGKIEAVVHKSSSPGFPELLQVLNDVLARSRG